MIPLAPPWREIVTELRLRYGTDDAVADELSKQGVLVDRTTLLRLRSGECKSPGPWGVGAALLNLMEIPKAHVKARASKAEIAERRPRVMQLRARGLSYRAISRVLNTPPATAWEDAHQ